MKMEPAERWFVNSALRIFFLRRTEAPLVLGNIGLPPGGACLEIGSGRGAGALLINRYLEPRTVVGVDIDPAMVREAVRYVRRRPRWARNIRNDNISFILQDAAGLAFRDGTFDAVFLFAALDHISNWREVIKEVRRVLKPGGVFSFEEFLLDVSPPNRFKHVSIAEAELRKTLEEAGFAVSSFTRMKLLPRCFVRAVKKETLRPGVDILEQPA